VDTAIINYDTRKGQHMARKNAPIITTTIGLPITSKPADQRLYRRIQASMVKRNRRARTEFMRVVFNEEADRLGVK